MTTAVKCILMMSKDLVTMMIVSKYGFIVRIEYLTCLAGLHHLILWLIERKCLYFHCPTPLPGEGGTSAYAYEIVTRLPVLALVFYPAAAYRIMNHFFVMVGKINMLIHIFFRMELECHRYMT